MKYIKKFENITDVEVGDYVVIQDTYSVDYNEKKAIWHNLYGIVIDIGYDSGDKNKTTKLCLVKILTKLNPEVKDFLLRQDDNTRNIKPIHEVKKRKIDLWCWCGNLVKYKTKEEYDQAVEKIKMEASINKYNL